MWLPATVNTCRYPFRHFLSILILLPLLTGFTAEAIAQTLPTVTITEHIGSEASPESNDDRIFTVTADSAVTADLVISYTVAGTATVNSGVFGNLSDHTLQASETITIVNGRSSESQLFDVHEDDIDEPDETIIITLTGGTGYNVGSPSSVTINIEDNDPTVVALTRTGGSGAVTEGTAIEFTVALGRALVAGEIIDVPLSIGGTGVTTADWSLAPKAGANLNTGVTLSGQTTATPQVSFAGVGAQVATLQLTPTADSVTEASGETFTIALGADGSGTNGFDRASLATNVGGGANPHASAASNTFNVMVNDPVVGVPSVTIARAQTGSLITNQFHVLGEGDDASAEFRVTASKAFTAATTVQVRIGGDPYTPTEHATVRNVPFAIGETIRTVSTTVNNDSIDRIDGEITATVVAGSGYTLGSSSTTSYTIVDNDPTVVTLSVTDSMADEDDATDTAKIQLSLNRGLVSGESLGIPLTFGGGALSDDFTLARMGNPAGVSLSGSTVTFTGPSTGTTATSTTLIVTAAQDTDTEDETVTVSIPAKAAYDPKNPYLIATGFHCRTTDCQATGTGSGTITLDDNDVAVSPTATFHIASQIYTEKGGTASARTHNARVNFSPALPANITLNYAVDGNATSGTDYTALSGTILVSAGANQVNIPIIVTDDSADEFIETVTLTLNNGSGYTVGSTRTYRLTLIDNDPTSVTLSTPDATATEGNATETAEITLTLGRALSVDLVSESLAIPLTFTGGTLNTDFSLALSGTPTGVSLSGSTVTFAHGNTDSATSATLILTALADANTNHETVTVNLGTLTPTALNGGASGSRSGNGQITLTDTGTQTLPVITIARGTSPVTEGTAATFTVTATPPPAAALSVNLTVTDAPNADFVSASNQQGTKTVTIPTGGSATYSVPTIADTTDEPNGPVTVTIAADTNNPAQYAIGNASSAQVTVNDDDAPQNPGTVNPPPTNPTPTQPVDPPPTNPVTPTTPGQPTDPQQPQEPEPEPVIPLLSIQASSDAVTEGAVATFTVTAEPAPAQPMTVPLIIAASGDFTAPQSIGAMTLTIDRETTALMIPTLQDFIDEADGRLTVTLQAANGYRLVSHPSATVAIHDDDTAGIQLSTQGLRIPEIGQHAQYTIQLTSQPAAPVTVTLIPPESARVTVSPSSVTFTPDHWNIPQTFTLTAHTEGSVTLVHAITSTDPNYSALTPARGRLAVRVGEDWSAVAASWQSRFMRTSTGHLLDGIAARIQATPTTGLQGQLAGYRMDATPKDLQSRWIQTPRSEPRSRAVTRSELLSASSLSWSATAPHGAIASLWAQGAWSEFDGQSGETTLDGEVLTTLIGVDQTQSTGQRGLVLSHSQGEGNYQSRDSGAIESEQTLLAPWWSQDLNDRMTLWGALGYGSGDLTLIRSGRPDLTTDTDTAFVALGSDSVLQEEAHRSLSVVSDALWLRTRADEAGEGMDLGAASAHLSRMRLGIKGHGRLTAIPGLPRFAPGQALTMKLESALRHDGGDAESGFGIEVGGGVQWIDSKRGLNLQIQGRSLITHHDSDIKDRGLSVSMGFEPSPIHRGLELTLKQDWGTVASGMERLLDADTIVENASSASQRLSAEAGYRFTIGDGRYTARPWLGVGLHSEDRETRLGWRLQSTIGRSERTLGLKLTRQETTGQPSEHHIQVEAGMRW